MGNPEGTQKSRTVLIIVLAALGGCMVACCGVGAVVLPPAIQQARNDHDESKADRLASLREEIPADAFDVEEVSDDNVLGLAYRLNEESEDQRPVLISPVTSPNKTPIFTNTGKPRIGTGNPVESAQNEGSVE